MEQQPGDVAPARYWENRYSDSGHIWSGAPNRTTVEVVSALAPGTALDLGCGEGADVVWLAQQGWIATGLDLSPTAVDRATASAEAAGLSTHRAHFVSTDLSTWDAATEYDLVTASFFHSPVALTRTKILRRAAGWVASGGHLLIVSHLSFPSRSGDQPGHGQAGHEQAGHDQQFLSPVEEIEALGLPSAEWTTVLAETRTRPATGTSAGEHLTLDDGVVLLRRA